MLLLYFRNQDQVARDAALQIIEEVSRMTWEKDGQYDEIVVITTRRATTAMCSSMAMM
jgi:hypothetical protein